MVIYHMVFFKFKPDVPNNFYDNLKEKIIELKSIEGVISIHCGKNILNPPRGDFNFGLLVQKIFFFFNSI